MKKSILLISSFIGLILNTGIAQKKLLIHLDSVVEVKYLDNQTIELIDKFSGEKRYKVISDIAGIFPISDSSDLVIDLRTIDTSLYSYKYKIWKQLPISNASFYPLIVGDTDQDGFKEVSGIYKPFNARLSEKTNRLYEFQPDSSFQLVNIYADSIIRSIWSGDIDNDELYEIIITHWGSKKLIDFESISTDSLAIYKNFIYGPFPQEGYPLGRGQFNTPQILHMDGDNKIDLLYFLYYGPDSADYSYSYHIAEYDPAINNFVLKYYFRPDEKLGLVPWGWGFATGDFDLDGKMEFATGRIKGDVYVVESKGDDSYEDIWKGEVETYNAFLALGTDDIDGNGKPEMWIGGDAYYRGIPITRLTCFETTGDNQYEPVYRIDLIGVISFFAGNMVASDVDNDGTDEIVLGIDGNIIIFKNIGIQQYELFYIKKNTLERSVYHAVASEDLDGDNIPELLISMDQENEEHNDIRYFSIIYKANFTSSIFSDGRRLPEKYSLFQNYPNPFNSFTTINYELPERSFVILKIYNVLGQEVKSIVRRELNPGEYKVTWDGTDNGGKPVASGVYLYQLKAGDFVKTKKLILLR